MALPCDPGACKDNATEAAVEAYTSAFRLQMIAQLAPVLYSSGRHGGYISSCFRHGTAAYDGAWSDWRVLNQSQSQTFAMWYSASGTRRWESSRGFLAAGGDVLPAQTMAVADARALCAATAGCAGITFEGGEAEPSVNVSIYFKNTSAVTDSAAWYTWLLAPPATAVVDGLWGTNPTCATY